MMTMLHSVWSGGGSAAGRRRSLLALGALLALIASVLAWASPIQAQGSNQPPVAIALTPSLSDDGNTMTLDGTLSFDPDDGDATGACVGCTYKWEVVTATWKFLEGFGTGLNVTTPVSAGAGVVDATINTTNVDFPSLVPSNGAIIEFRLTVTDSKGASDSDTASYNIMTNDTPTADISLSAMVADPEADDDATNAEKYTIDGVIDGPGENGNADNEWDIMEGAILVLDGSGSSDPDDDDLNYLWSLVYEAGTNSDVGFPTNEAGTSTASTLTATGATTAKISTDTSVPGTADANPTVGRLNVARAATATSQSPYQVVYTLAVTDAGAAVTDDNTDSTALIRIVIHDEPADPEITAVLLDATPTDPQVDTEGIDRAFPPSDKYFVHEDIAGNVDIDGDGTNDAHDITLTPVTFDADQDLTGNGSHTTDGTPDSGETPPSVVWSVDDANSTTDGYQFRIPGDAEAGDSFTTTVSIPRTDVSRTLTFEVIEAQQRPVATILSGNAAIPGQPAFLLTDTADDDGMFTITGFGFDPDGGSTNSVWTQIIDRAPADPSDDEYVPLTGAFSNAVSFSTPDDEDITTMTLAFTVFDDESTFDSKTLIVNFDHSMAPTDPASKAGPDQVVAPESTVILSGSSAGIDFATDGAAGNYTWTITGVSTNPAPERLGSRASAQVHTDLNAFLEVWNNTDIDNADDDDTATTGVGNSDETSTTEGIANILTGISAPTGATGGQGQFQFFTAPKLTAGLKYAQIEFTLTVDPDGTPGNDDDEVDTVTITVASDFFSSYIDNPDYCRNKSLGGPETYPHDSNGDGVADVCSLDSTRRVAVARQNALQQLADLGLTIDVTDAAGRTSGATLTDLVIGRDGVDASDGPDATPDTADDVAAVSAIVGTCARAKALGLETNDADACDDDATELTPPPDPVDPADADLFYSGVIDGPDFCTNHSLGGARTYAHDSDDDGVADVCSLPTTRREAIAKQMALEMFDSHSQYPTAFAAACTALGSETFGGSAEALAADACSVGLTPMGPGMGTELPSPSS